MVRVVHLKEKAMSETGVADGAGVATAFKRKFRGWRDPISHLIHGKYTDEQWKKLCEESRKRKRTEALAEANAKIQEIEVTRGTGGFRFKFIGQWDSSEKAALIQKCLMDALASKSTIPGK